MARRSGPQEAPGWVVEVFAAWRDWQAGHPPGRAMGRGAQNPRLMAAFDRLDQVQIALDLEAQERARRDAERLARRQR